MSAQPGALPADLAWWRRAFGADLALVERLAPGSRVALVDEEAVQPGADAGAAMVVWARSAQGLQVSVEPFGGFEAVAADLLIAVDATARRKLATADAGTLAPTLRALLREAHLLFFARRPRAELEEAGYEDLLETLGFAFLGACR